LLHNKLSSRKRYREEAVAIDEMVERVLAQVVLLVIEARLRTVAPDIEVDEKFDLAAANFDLFVGVAQLLDEQREEFRGVFEVFILLDEIFELVGASELVEVVPDSVSEVLS